MHSTNKNKFMIDPQMEKIERQKHIMAPYHYFPILKPVKWALNAFVLVFFVCLFTVPRICEYFRQENNIPIFSPI